MDYNIEYLPIADDDLYEIADYFSGFFPGTLTKFMNKLEKHISKLQDSHILVKNIKIIEN